MPQEMVTEHGIVSATIPRNSHPKTLLAAEVFRNSRTHGTAIRRTKAKQVRHTTTDQKNNVEATLDSSQFRLIPRPSLSCEYGRVHRFPGACFRPRTQNRCFGSRIRDSEFIGPTVPPRAESARSDELRREALCWWLSQSRYRMRHLSLSQNSGRSAGSCSTKPPV